MNNGTNVGGGVKERLWGAIKEVEVAAIPSFVPTLRRSKWADLYDEVMLRLEETPAKFALAVPFEDQKAARAAKGAISSMTHKRHGPGYICTAVRPNGKGWIVYMRRGPNYK